MIFLVQYSGYQLGTAIKQADAVLLGFPLSLPMSRSTRANDLQLYAGSVRESGPAMTWAMHAIGQVGTSNHKQNYKNNTAAQLISTSYQEYEVCAIDSQLILTTNLVANMHVLSAK